MRLAGCPFIVVTFEALRSTHLVTRGIDSLTDRACSGAGFPRRGPWNVPLAGGGRSSGSAAIDGVLLAAHEMWGAAIENESPRDIDGG